MSLIIGEFEQILHFNFLAKQPSCIFLTSITLWHFEHLEETLRLHFLQLYVSKLKYNS